MLHQDITNNIENKACKNKLVYMADLLVRSSQS